MSDDCSPVRLSVLVVFTNHAVLTMLIGNIDYICMFNDENSSSCMHEVNCILRVVE